MKNLILAIALLFSPLLATAQLGQFGGGGNNGAAAATFTFTGVLASIPATCTVGQLAFITNATAGQNIYECTATNTWTQQSGGASINSTTGTIPVKSGASTFGDSHLVDSANHTADASGNVTAASVAVGTSPPAVTAGSSGAWGATEGTAPTNVASTGVCWMDSTSHEVLCRTNGSALSGMLVRAQNGAINQTSKVAAISTATLCAASAGACNQIGQYHIHFNFWGSGTACSTVTAGSVTFLLTWTDENATAHSAVVVPVISQTGATSAAAGNSFLFQTALANESASGDFTISTNGSVIQYTTGYTACTTGTGTYNLRATVTRVQ